MLYFPKWKLIAVLALTLIGIAYAIPSLLPPPVLDRLPDWLPHGSVALRLDLNPDAIRTGAIGSGIAGLLVALLMIAGYGIFGVIAVIALLLNLVFILAILAFAEMSLTIPGICGMALGTAIALDAHVLLYERMREENDRGRSEIPAVDSAFQRAYGTILDSNLAILVATILLAIFGSGGFRGFAVTLAIGIVSSLLMTLTITKLMCITWVARRKPKLLPI